jgi:DHA1 family bicyclomycin/chloramphenicol resistance-like MFS transporter
MSKRRLLLFYALLLGYLTMVGPIAIDGFLPAVPAIANGLGVGISSIEFSLTAIFAGNALGQILYGPLADRFGRKPIILLTLSIYFAATIGAGLSETVGSLVFWRFLQGLVLASGRILSNAVSRDLFERDKLAKLITGFMLVGAASTLGAGPLGGYLSENFSWQSIFWCMSIYSGSAILIFWLFYKETLQNKDFRALRFATLARNFSTILSNRNFLFNVLCGGFVLSGLVAYLNSSSGILIGTFGIKPGMYGILLSMVMIGYMAATATAGKLIDTLGMKRLIQIGSFTVATGGIVMFGLALANINHAAAVLAPMVIFMFGFAFVLPQTTSASLTPFPQIAGAASSLQGFIQNSMAAILSALLSTFSDGTAIPMAAAIAVCGILTVVIYVLYIRRL